MLFRSIGRARNPLFHRKVFAVAKCICDNIETGDDAYMMIKRCMVEAGEVVHVKLLSGEYAYIPKSISYDEMDQAEFERVFRIVLNIGAQLLDCTPEELCEHSQEYI